ncbi:MAG TPA: fructose-bisphosphatase class III [Vicinamibacteria bacterium]|nr:fructose-bisphosphatase class III [Vicinamibacteria bacterium]
MRSSAQDSDSGLAALRALSKQFRDEASATAEIARLTAELTLPKGAIHVMSDVHGEDVKMRHIINNASGTLRPLVDRVFAERPRADREDLLTLLFYPVETLDQRLKGLSAESRRAFVLRALDDLLTVVRTLASRTSIQRVGEVLPAEYAEILREMLHESFSARGSAYVAAIVDPLLAQGGETNFIRLVVRVVRNLAVREVIVAGDCVDRGPRGDRVLEYLRQLPRVAVTWGNHDLAWLGAALGHDALIAHVLRISTRYRRLSQLEEGYGLTMQPLERLVRSASADDPATCFMPYGAGLRETLTMARMQKAAAVMQFKLEGQMIARHPEWKLEHRRLFRTIDPEKGTIMVDGKAHPLKDRHFPTLDPGDPEALSEGEEQCLHRMRASFLKSPLLWDHARFLVARGSSWLSRDNHLVFHGCVPVDEAGAFLSMNVDGAARAGRALFDAIDDVVARALNRRDPDDLDFLWYLWSGPLSPMFGKDRITTLERDLIEDPALQRETKNPYFTLIHDPAFCERVLEEFGCDPSGLIVNGHVPVKIDAGESPVKRGGNAITIDGAFSQAYGDHGYTLVLESDRTFLARHHHFESVEAAVRDGVDIIPTLATIRDFDPPRFVGDTEEGERIRADIALLARLVDAYRHHRV